MTEYTFEKLIQKAESRLPALLTREIGRVITRWAFYEQHIQYIIYAVVFLDEMAPRGLARTAIRETRPEEQLNLLERISEIHKVSYDKVLLKSMRKRSKPLIEKRNLYAHGVWSHVPRHGWCVQQTRGTWEEDSADAPTGRKAIEPEVIATSVEQLKATVKELDELIDDAAKLKLSFEKPTSP
jgi:hypothetical protein